MTQLEQLLVRLVNFEVEFVLIGGLAGIVHGSNRATFDVDIVYARSDENIRRLVSCFAEINPYLRGAPPGLPFSWDVNTVESGLNFTLTTSIGDIDLLGEATGNGTFAVLMERSIEISIFGVSCRCVTLAKLIELKRAAGRPKDIEAIAELEYLLSQLDENEEDFN